MKRPFAYHVLLCKDCANFDRPSDLFKSANLRRCRVDGRKHWAGDDAGNCESFAQCVESNIAALASGY